MSWTDVEFDKIKKDDIIRFIVLNNTHKNQFVSPVGVVTDTECELNNSDEKYIKIEEMFSGDPFVWVYKKGLFQYQKWNINNDK